jgi:hypothetical protein
VIQKNGEDPWKVYWVLYYIKEQRYQRKDKLISSSDGQIIIINIEKTIIFVVLGDQTDLWWIHRCSTSESHHD